MVTSPILIIILLSSLCFGALLVYVVLSSRHHKAGASDLCLLGMNACVNTSLQPEGAVLLNGELWRVRLTHVSETLRPGQKVRVVGADGHLLLVEPAD